MSKPKQMMVINYLPKKETELTKDQIRALEQVFRATHKPTKDTRLQLKLKLGLPLSAISSWFQARLLKHTRQLKKQALSSCTPQLPPAPPRQVGRTDPALYLLAAMRSTTTPDYCEDLRLPSLQARPTIPAFKSFFASH